MGASHSSGSAPPAEATKYAAKPGTKGGASARGCLAVAIHASGAWSFSSYSSESNVSTGSLDSSSRRKRAGCDSAATSLSSATAAGGGGGGPSSAASSIFE